MDTASSPARRKIWQVAFLSGIAACILSAIVVLGTSLFATVLTVSTLFIGILNALLGASSGGKGENWFVSTARHALEVSMLLKVATVAVWVTALSLVGYGFLQARHEAQIITLEGYVLTAGGQPAGNAVVTLLTTAKKELVTGADGKFAFTKVDLSREPSKQLRLEITWEQLSKAETVDVSGGPPSQLRITMPPGAPPFRVLYRFAEEKAIDLLIRGQIDAKWDEGLSGTKAIIPNRVFNSLQYLTNNFSELEEETEGGDDAYVVQTKSGTKRDRSLAKKLIGKPAFVGSSGGELRADVTREDLLSLTDPKKGWNAVIDPAPVEGSLLLSLTFWRFANRDDVRRLAANPEFTTAKFYDYIAGESLPSDFGIVMLSSTNCSDTTETSMSLVPRMLRARVAVIENISSGPIKFENFTVKESKEEILRDRQQEDSAQAAQSTTDQDLYSAELLPHERLEIPVEMSLIYNRSENPWLEFLERPAKVAVRNKVLAELSRTDHVTFHFGTDSTVDVDAKQILELLNRPKRDAALGKEYVFGPSVKIESVKVNGVSYPFREYDSRRVAIRNDVQIGSCPNIYTYDAQAGSWIREGHILYGRNGRLKESVDEMELERFDGRVVLKEEDPEVSFIDSLLVRVITLDGRELFLLPDNRKLRFSDGDYVQLKRGEQLELRFKVPANASAEKYLLIANGYYVPIKNARMGSGPRQ